MSTMARVPVRGAMRRDWTVWDAPGEGAVEEDDVLGGDGLPPRQDTAQRVDELGVLGVVGAVGVPVHGCPGG
jgi:hypothetical protein